MGNSQSSTIKINYEDMQYLLQHPSTYLLINTLPNHEQSCLIQHTVNCHEEEAIINACLKTRASTVKIVIYGKNSNDEKIYSKYQQLTSLGFVHVYMYTGGLFEWLMLQDIYGEKEFPTTSKELDILKYKPTKAFNVHLLEY